MMRHPCFYVLFKDKQWYEGRLFYTFPSQISVSYTKRSLFAFEDLYRSLFAIKHTKVMV